MVVRVSDTASHRRDQIDNLAELLEDAPTRQALVRAVYFGKKREKSVVVLAQRLTHQIKNLTPKRVTIIGKPLVNLFFGQERVREDGKMTTAYVKFDSVQRDLREILKLANNKKKRSAYHTKTKPKVRAVGHTVTISVAHAPRVESISIDEVQEFSKVRPVKEVPAELFPNRLPEAIVKKGIVRLLGDQIEAKDWGGESNDIFTTRITLEGKRKRAAFALKEPAKTGGLVPKMMGKNGDQIQRLFTSPAQVFLVQYEGEIRESIVDLMGRLATAKAVTERDVYYGVIDLTDTRRLRYAYPKQFES